MSKNMIKAGRRMLLTLCMAALCVTALGVTALGLTTDIYEDPGKPVKVSRVEISQEFTTVRVNQIRTLYADVFPRDAADQIIYWESANPEIVTVDDEGIVTGISPGVTEITVYASNNKKATCTVTVPSTVLTEIELDTRNKDTAEAEITGGDRVSAATLRLNVETAAKNTAAGQKAVVTYDDKAVVSTAALRSAAFSAEYQKREVSLRFRTKNEANGIQGQMTIDPKLAGDKDMDIQLGVYAGSAKTAAAKEKARELLGSRADVVVLEHQGALGMTVKVAAKVELAETGEALALYRLNSGTGGYELLPDQACQIDSNGYLHFSTDQGGTVVIAPKV